MIFCFRFLNGKSSAFALQYLSYYVTITCLLPSNNLPFVWKYLVSCDEMGGFVL